MKTKNPRRPLTAQDREDARDLALIRAQKKRGLKLIPYWQVLEELGDYARAARVKREEQR